MHAHTVEYDSALKREDSLRQVSTWMNLEDMMPSEIKAATK